MDEALNLLVAIGGCIAVQADGVSFSDHQGHVATHRDGNPIQFNINCQISVLRDNMLNIYFARRGCADTAQSVCCSGNMVFTGIVIGVAIAGDFDFIIEIITIPICQAGNCVPV